VLGLLRVDEASVADDVELTGLARPDLRVVPVLRQLGRETRGPSVVAASDGAIEDLDAHTAERTCSAIADGGKEGGDDRARTLQDIAPRARDVRGVAAR
jgi:hypothetical protein